MESKDGSVQETAGDVSELETLFQLVGEFIKLVEQVLQKLKDVKPFYTANREHPNTPEGVSLVGDENWELGESSNRRQRISYMLTPVLQKLKDVKLFYPANREHPNTPGGVSLVGDENREKLGESSKNRQLISHGKQKQKEDDSGMEQYISLSEEAANAKIARDLTAEIVEINKLLDKFRDLAIDNCRKMTTEEKRRLRVAIDLLSPEGVTKVIHFLAPKTPISQSTVEIDLTAQSDSTWLELKSFVGNLLQAELVEFFK